MILLKSCTVEAQSMFLFSLAQNMEATRSHKTSVDFKQMTQHYIREDGTLQIIIGFLLCAVYA
jgi:hypothetical protein